MTKEDTCDDLKRKRERNETCLNCRNYLSCNYIAQFEECDHFEELKGEAWVISKLG